MFRRIIFPFLLISFLALPAKVIAADVVINEVFANPDNEDNEYVELFNLTDQEIDLSNWKIADKVKTYTIADLKISGKGFVSLKKSTTGIQLNNVDEELKLKNAQDQEIDTFSYGETVTNKSWSRYPDGTGSFVNNTNTTENTANSAPPPTATPVPTNTPKPTETPVPTKSPTPTLTPTKNPTPTVAPKITPVASVIAKSPTPTKKIEIKDARISGSDLMLASNVESDVLGVDSDSNTPTPEVKILGESTSSPTLFIILGLIFLVVCGILSYFQFGNKIFIWKRKENL